ncbi:hypothetical protein L1987_13687 [Smallanthus sonchifolius]|uniref:Uncharacterized protein n=1 Tax=Smallanthus sonchifolius TaxID=185202 RepID=A0ACB9JJA0_9ASTR|nr:hypothetical protein L1987_13687 [Smallanthus sonchifolius]
MIGLAPHMGSTRNLDTCKCHIHLLPSQTHTMSRLQRRLIGTGRQINKRWLPFSAPNTNGFQVNIGATQNRA